MRLISFASVAVVFSVAALSTVIYLGLYRAQRCEKPGDPCCRADSEVKTDHCHQGLGCNVTAGRCEACGAPGQVCCDGDFTGFSQKGYNGLLLDPRERVESCDKGAFCDAHLAADGESWTGTRRCGACGSQQGGSCCPPDVRYGLGRCFPDARSGRRLTCNDPWLGDQGTCVPCGRSHGEIACASSFPCDDGLVAENGICVVCGVPGAPTCDRGEPCRGDDSVPGKPNWSHCVAAGGLNQPCRKSGGCSNHGLFCNEKKVCEPCGDGGQRCCPPGIDSPCQLARECRDGRCFACGYENMPVCAGGSPCPFSGEPEGGMCRPCGRPGQLCCFGLSIRCFDHQSCRERKCTWPPTPGGSSGNLWKTCGGQPYTWSTQPTVVFIEDANGCTTAATWTANTPEEALQCARAAHGDAVVGLAADSFAVAVTCPATGCNQRTYPARDQSSAESCAEATNLGCTVEGGGCF